MINIQIPKDVREYQPKFIGAFTFRQAVCLAIVAGINAGGIFIQQNFLGMKEVNYIPQMILSIIPLFFGWGEEALRMKPESYLRTVFKNMFFIPKTRVYKSRNYYDIYFKPVEKEEEVKQEKMPKKKDLKNMDPEFVPYQ